MSIHHLSKERVTRQMTERVTQRCSINVFLKFAKFTVKHLCCRNTCPSVKHSIFLTKLQAYSLQLYQKETSAQVFSCKFCKIFKNIFKSFTELLKKHGKKLAKFLGLFLYIFITFKSIHFCYFPVLF